MRERERERERDRERERGREEKKKKREKRKEKKKVEEDVGRKSYDRRHRHATKDADPSNGLCFSSFRSL